MVLRPEDERPAGLSKGQAKSTSPLTVFKSVVCDEFSVG